MHVFVIGIGAGDPDYLTLQAVRAIRACDLFLVPDKGEEKTDLKDARIAMIADHARKPDIIEIAMPARERTPADYRATVGDWHARIADAWATALRGVPTDARVGLLVWGDPSLYDSTLRIVAALRAGGLAFDLEVVPGITAIQALCARHRVPLNAIGEAVVVTTGRKLGRRMPDDAAAVVVMLDGEQAFARIEDDVEIFWGAYLGTSDEILVAGRLAEVKETILAAREKARGRKGWIMDTYLLRRRS